METLFGPYGVEWLNLLVRWLHLITGIAWIGASFYFVWLDNSIRPPKPGSPLAKKGVSGELWAVHGGGFYNPQKYLVAPEELPEDLHWFKWEAYATWISGFAMLFIVYYFNASAMMIDKSVADLTSLQAIGVGLGTLAGGWLVYDALCKTKLGEKPAALGVVLFVLIVAAAYVLTHTLSGRAAYIHVGAMIGTMMVGNVLFVIIPGQRKLVEAMERGESPDPIYGKRAKVRSVHNNYFTLPVLLIMISNHYAMTYSHAYSWLVLAAIMAAGVLIRHFFNLRHAGKVSPAYPIAGVILLAAVAVAIAPAPRKAVAAQAAAGADATAHAAHGPATGAQGAAPVQATLASVHQVMAARCASCHSAAPTQAGFASAPGGVMLDTPEQVKQHAAKIYQRAVQNKDMPLANMTHMTDAERAMVGTWFEAGVN
ncbi:urate hydroxylase PuuD [Pseudoduganella sp.]|uniref:urate hydroxylase PuuD n=1 Tax=Pseudoduganella sp. TaxID=1880898 RepID=UPI0035B18F71